MTKKTYLPNISKKEKKSKTVFKQTIFYFNAYFVPHIFRLRNGIFDFQYLKSKHKIYILSKNFLLKICRPHLGK